MLVTGILGPACGPTAPAEPFLAGAKIGFLFVGSRDDLGYNQAAWEGSEAVARAFPDHEVIRVEGVPETGAAADAIERLIDRGARIIFPTSFGHLPFAYEVAERHPDVFFVHQGGVEPEPRLDNLGTYFGSHHEGLYQAGIAAAAATSSGMLGFVAAFPIPATYNNVNAFTLGARSVRPDAVTRVIFTGDWCDPERQATAAEQLLGAGVDVIAQHQDCTRTILEAAEAAGAFSVGYHSDGSEVAPRGWLAGAVWLWDDLYVDIARTILRGDFGESPYNGDFRGSLASRNSPVILTEPGPSVTPETAALMDAAAARFAAGGSPFEGPVVDRNGTVRVKAGEQLGSGEVDAMNWLVDGVVGAVPAP